MYVSGMYVKSSLTPTVSAGATNYAVGDSIGGKLTFLNVPDEGVVNTVITADEGAEAKAMELWLFDTNLTAAVTDNGAFNPDDADIPNCVGVIPINVFATVASNGIGQAKQCGVSYRLEPGASRLYGVLVDRAGGYVFDATDALTIVLHILR